jgi:hypothetical protein
VRSSSKEADCNTCAQYVPILSDPKSKSVSHYNRIRFDPNKLKSMLQSQRSDEHVRLPTQYSTSCVNKTLTKDDKSPVTGNSASKNPVNQKPSSVAPSIGSRVHRDIPSVSALSFNHEGAALSSPKSRSSPRESVIVPLARLRRREPGAWSYKYVRVCVRLAANGERQEKKADGSYIGSDFAISENKNVYIFSRWPSSDMHLARQQYFAWLSILMGDF